MEEGLGFVDLFSGIGGIRQGFERHGHKAVAFSEIDKYAIKAYKTLYGEYDRELGDVSVISDEELSLLVNDVDLVIGGSPCQAFSVAGGRGGFDDTRGSLFFEYCRVLKQTQPKYFLFENVKGVLSHDKGQTIDTMIRAFNEVGYTVDLNLLNSKYFGVPQNRERIFVVGVRSDLISQEEWIILGSGVLAQGRKRLKEAGDIKTFNFNWPQQVSVDTRLRDVLESEVDEKYYINEEKTAKLIAELIEKDKTNDSKKATLDQPSPVMVGMIETKGNESIRRVYGINGVCNTLTTMQGGNREPKIAEPQQVLATLTPERVERRQQGRRFKDNDEPAFTLTALDRHGVTIINGGDMVEEKEANTFKILRKLQNEVGTEKVAKWRFRVLDSFQQKEVLRQSMYEKTPCDDKPTKINREQQPCECTIENKIHDGDQKLPKVRLCEELGCSPQGREPLQQFVRELAGIMQELSHQNTSIKVLCSLWEETQGIGLLRQALSEIQKIWRPELHKKQSYRVRKLTPLETWRLQSFSDEDFYKVKESGMSDSQLYKQAGNCVTINVIDAIAKNMTALHKQLEEKSLNLI